MQSQQPWIISQQALSPLVQVRTQPSLVISHLHMPMVRQQQQTVMPFIMQQTEHMPPAIIVQRLCIMAQADGSSHTQVIFMPVEVFSTLKVHRGTMTMFGVPVGIPPVIGEEPIPMPMPGIPVVVRSIIIALVMIDLRAYGKGWSPPNYPSGPHFPTTQTLGKTAPLRRVPCLS
jgi:hypothetical protein